MQFTAQCFSANRRNFIDEIVKHRPIKIQSFFFEFYAFIRLVQFTITPSRWEFFLSKSSVWPHNSRNVFHLAKPLEFSRRISSFMIAMTEHSSREKRKKNIIHLTNRNNMLQGAVTWNTKQLFCLRCRFLSIHNNFFAHLIWKPFGST